jgi:N,N'-diacetyllegionaminate synthase
MVKVFVIAEAGVNHNGNIESAFRLVDQAIFAGADAVKFQTAIPELVATDAAQKACYQKRETGSEESQLDMIKKLLLPIEAFEEIAAYCKKKKIIFFSTAFDSISLTFLEKLGQPFHKIPSGEVTNLPYLRQIGGYRKPTILSTGMATLGEVEAAIHVLEKSGLSRDKLTIMHCNTDYPTQMSDVNLRAMQTIGNAFSVAIGYSDHTIGSEVAVAAVALGATIIEKHLTLSQHLPGPDHKASLEPDQFRELVTAIRNIESALGSSIKQPSSSELQNKTIIRRSLVAALPIKAGEKFTCKNLTAKRPGSGLSPMLWDDVIGRVAIRDFALNELIVL